MTNDIAYWNNDAVHYDSRNKKSYNAYQNIISLIKSEVSPEMDVLDIGTGTGEIPINLCNDVHRIEAVDYSPEMIKIAKHKSENSGIQTITFRVQDCNSLNYNDNSFDVIIIINVLHITPEPERLLKEAERLIKKDGKIIIATFLHDETIISRLISFVMKKKGHPIITKFNSETACKFVEQCSMKIVSKNKIKNIMPMLFMTVVKN